MISHSLTRVGWRTDAKQQHRYRTIPPHLVGKNPWSRSLLYFSRWSCSVWRKRAYSPDRQLWKLVQIDLWTLQLLFAESWVPYLYGVGSRAILNFHVPLYCRKGDPLSEPWQSFAHTPFLLSWGDLPESLLHFLPWILALNQSWKGPVETSDERRGYSNEVGKGHTELKT